MADMLVQYAGIRFTCTRSVFGRPLRFTIYQVSIKKRTARFPVLNISNVQAADAGTYYVEIVNENGKAFVRAGDLKVEN